MSVTASWSGGNGSWGVIVHGGAGEVPPERRADRAAGCRLAAEAAKDILAAGGSALDAAQRAVEVLEDDPRFNAGTGACLTSEGRLELDAAIMDGERLRAGGVCGLPAFQHPIAIARAALDHGKHVVYAASGAEAFAKQAGFKPADESTMITASARLQLARALAKVELGPIVGGTVGAVARDRAGNLAAATSTGGMVGKLPGRVGDSPILGAGTYADNLAGAASATGEGEGILRITLTAQVVSCMRAGDDPETAARSAIGLMSERIGATGGVIVVHPSGRMAFARSTETMPWAAAWEGAETVAGS